MRALSGRFIYVGDNKSGEVDLSAFRTGSDVVVPYSVSGESRTLTATMTQTWSAIRTADVEIQTSLGTMSREVGMVNEPDLLEFVAHAEFETTPTASDADADGAGDWTRQDAGAFDGASISDGVWGFDSQIQTTFAETSGPLHAEIRWKSTNSSVLSFFVPSDHDGTDHLWCQLSIRRGGSGQTLGLSARDSEGSTVTLDTVDIDHTDFVDVTLQVDPVSDLAMLTVDGVARAPVNIPKATYAANNTRFILKPGSGTGEVDRVLVKVGAP